MSPYNFLLTTDEKEVIAVVGTNSYYDKENFTEKVAQAVAEHFTADEGTTKVVEAQYYGEQCYFEVEYIDNGEPQHRNINAEIITIY